MDIKVSDFLSKTRKAYKKQITNPRNDVSEIENLGLDQSVISKSLT